MRDITTWSRTGSVHRPQLFKRKESRLKRNRTGQIPPVSVLTRLTPYRLAKPTYTPDSASRLLYVHGSYGYGLLGTGSPTGTATSTDFHTPGSSRALTRPDRSVLFYQYDPAGSFSYNRCTMPQPLGAWGGWGWGFLLQSRPLHDCRNFSNLSVQVPESALYQFHIKSVLLLSLLLYMYFLIQYIYICEQVLFVYVSTLIPPCLTDQRNFITVLIVTREPEQTTLLFWSAACGVTPHGLYTADRR